MQVWNKCAHACKQKELDKHISSFRVVITCISFRFDKIIHGLICPQGKHRLLRRNDNVATALKNLKLGVDPEEFDFHYGHTHGGCNTHIHWTGFMLK